MFVIVLILCGGGGGVVHGFVLCYGPLAPRRRRLAAVYFLVEVPSCRLADGLAMACPAPISRTDQSAALRVVVGAADRSRHAGCPGSFCVCLAYLLEAAFPSQRAKALM